ncbi:probable lysine/arginine permease Can3p [[Candida] anglica]|uniref:Probable lysine/arginine permease Can3p n=1 Tax=[Candida] anglica TaxID=148631 RepID=A0ABP0EFT5_9ASCO
MMKESDPIRKNYDELISATEIPDEVDSPNGGNLKRDFKQRHVTMLTLASAIGTGLIIGSGTALKRGGTVSIFLAYIFTGSLLLVVIYSLAEMASFLPMQKGFSGYCTKYVDPAIGFAAGWNYFLKYAVVLSANLTAAGLVIEYWRDDLNIGIWISILYVLVIASNYLSVRFYGELEYWLAAAKLLVLAIIFIVCIVITSGGAPNHETIGFRFWRETPFLPYLVKGSTGKFLGWWACVIQSLFGFIGSEMVGIVFGEAPNPRETIPKSSRQVIFRIAFIYILGVFLLGLAVSPQNPLLVKAGGTNANASPFVIAIKSSGIEILPSFINACLLIFIASSANTDLYICSRQLYGLAQDGAAPRIFLKLNKYGVPFIGCLFAAIFGSLAYLNEKDTASEVFGYITSTVSIFGVINWIYILVAYIGYYRAIVEQHVPRDDIPFRMWWQPYSTYVALFLISIVTIFNGYSAFIHKFNYKLFITSYVGIVANVVLIIGYKIWHKTSFVKPSEVDLINP